MRPRDARLRTCKPRRAGGWAARRRALIYSTATTTTTMPEPHSNCQHARGCLQALKSTSFSCSGRVCWPQLVDFGRKLDSVLQTSLVVRCPSARRAAAALSCKIPAADSFTSPTWRPVGLERVSMQTSLHSVHGSLSLSLAVRCHWANTTSITVRGPLLLEPNVLALCRSDC